MKKILITVLCIVASQSLYARALHCPEKVYFDGDKLFVDNRSGDWGGFYYPDNLKAGTYYFAYAKAFINGERRAECGYTFNGGVNNDVIKIFGPTAKPGFGYWSGPGDERDCFSNICSFEVN